MAYKDFSLQKTIRKWLCKMVDKSKIARGNSAQFFVAGELCRMGFSAVVTLGNTPNTDILCSNLEGTKFAHIQVKTFQPGNKKCTVGQKAEKPYGDSFFWVLAGIPEPDVDRPHEYYIIPASVMAKNILEDHQNWLAKTDKNGEPHKDSAFRVVHLPPYKSGNGWDISGYLNKWSLIKNYLVL